MEVCDLHLSIIMANDETKGQKIFLHKWNGEKRT